MPEVATRLAQLNHVFDAELADRVAALNELLALLERDWDDSALVAVARGLHGLKAAARVVEADDIEQHAHALETTVLAARELPRAPADWFVGVRAEVAALERSRTEMQLAQPDAAVQRDATSSAGQPEVVQLLPVRGPAESDRPGPTPERTEQGSVRVALGKLDTLLTESGELSVTQLRISERLGELRAFQAELERWQSDWNKSRPARARVRRMAHRGSRESEALLRATDHADRQAHVLVQHVRELVSSLAQNTAQLATVSRAIGEEVMAIRLLPVQTVFAPLERLVRDMAKQMSKDVRFEQSGTGTEVDRRILDELRDPLMHMVRNSVDHGLEPSAERIGVGKPAQGRIKLSASQRGDRVHLVIEDDGRGLDLDAIRAVAIKRNLLTAERAEALEPAALIDLIFQPGFSTRSTVTATSGRGVGMDVVRDHVVRLGGDIRVATVAGQGTTLTISVPLTLATTRVLLVEDGDQVYAIPSSSIERTGRLRTADVRVLEGRPTLQVDGRVIPIVELASVLQTRDRADAGSAATEWRPFVVLPQGDRAIALLTDRLVDETELVVKGLGAPLGRVRHVAGAAVLGTGAVVVILNPSDLFKSAQSSLEIAPGASRFVQHSATEDAPRRRVMVVDDSVMTRTLERSILESAGYSVVVASDGEQALELLAEAPVDAIVSDIEMPRMTGLELTSSIRQDERWRHLPILLVTSLDAPDQIERGAAAGADAYIVKGRFDQNDLLQTLGRLL